MSRARKEKKRFASLNMTTCHIVRIVGGFHHDGRNVISVQAPGVGLDEQLHLLRRALEIVVKEKAQQPLASTSTEPAHA